LCRTFAVARPDRAAPPDARRAHPDARESLITLGTRTVRNWTKELKRCRSRAEIVFVLGERLAGPGVSLTDARRAIAGAAAAMEIVDSRIVDWRIRLADTVADLASNGAVAVSGRLVKRA